MSTHYKFIDEDNIEDLQFFWEKVLKPKETHNLVSLSLSVREKLLTTEQRKLFPTPMYAMCQRRSIYGDKFSMFMRELWSYEFNKYSLVSPLDEISSPPQESMRVYTNINLTDGRRIPALLVSELCNYGFAQGYSNANEKDRLTERNIKLCIKGGDKIIQQNGNIKLWADYDIDFVTVPKNIEEFAVKVHKCCWSYLPKGSFMLITSPNGLHITIRNQSFKCNPVGLLKDISNLGYDFKEVVRNKNDMIVLPGTIAYNKNKEVVPIRILNKEDFE